MYILHKNPYSPNYKHNQRFFFCCICYIIYTVIVKFNVCHIWHNFATDSLHSAHQIEGFFISAVIMVSTLFGFSVFVGLEIEVEAVLMVDVFETVVSFATQVEGVAIAKFSLDCAVYRGIPSRAVSQCSMAGL